MKQQVRSRIGWRMTRLAACGVVGLLCMTTTPSARAETPAVLARGINITHWFRFPPSNRAQAMSHNLDDTAIASLKQAGFTYIRLAIGPEEVMQDLAIQADKLTAIIDVVARIEHAGLGVMIEPHPEQMQHWNLQHNQQARAKLLGFWHDLAPALKRFPARLTFPELVNEPSFEDPKQWDAFQGQLLSVVRAILPNDTIILTGTNWSSIDGLLKVQPVADRNVIYSFHTYEPQLLTLLGFWDPAINKDQLARYLPFPVNDPAVCKTQVAQIHDPHTLGAAQYWCSLRQNPAAVLKNLTRASNWGHTHQVSVVMTEFGAVQKLAAPVRVAYLTAVRQSADQLGLGWALWGLDDQMGFSQPAGGYRTASQLEPGVMHALGVRR